MVDEKLRKALINWCEEEGIEEDEQPLLFDNHAYDKSIVGITHDNRIVYDYESMIQEFMADENCSYEEAVEWIDYNTIRSLGYGDNGHQPIILQNTVQNIKEMYGGQE